MLAPERTRKHKVPANVIRPCLARYGCGELNGKATKKLSVADCEAKIAAQSARVC